MEVKADADFCASRLPDCNCNHRLYGVVSMTKSILDTYRLGGRQKSVLVMLAFWGKWVASGYPSWNYSNRSTTQKIMNSLEVRGLVYSNGPVYRLTVYGTRCVQALKSLPATGNGNTRS